MVDQNEERILQAVTSKLKDAVKFSNSNISLKQEKALRHYKREYLPGDEKIRGASRWVSPEVAQRVDWCTANLTRIFDSPENVVEFIPQEPSDEALARQQTKIANWVLKTKNSHVAFLHPWLMNGLLTSLGIVTAEFETTRVESLPRLIKGVPDDQLAMFTEQEDQGLIVIEAVGKPVLDQMTGMNKRDLKIRNVTKKHNLLVTSVAPEDFIISKDARFDQETGGIAAKVQGHRHYMSRDELLEAGFDAEKVKRIPEATAKVDGIALERTKDVDHSNGVERTDVEVYQIYTKLKLDKVTRHYRLTLAGDLDSPVLLDYTETSRIAPYAGFVPFPIPDTLFGLGIADKIADDHILLSKMNRAVLDSLNLAVNPIKIVNPDVTNLDDVLNPVPNGVIRSSEPSGGISWNPPPFAGAQAIPVIDRLSQSLDMSTGVGSSMVSLNASDLQDVTATAANQRTNASQLLIEMISRFFADTGYRYLVRIIIDLLSQNPDEAAEFLARLLNEQSIPVDEFQPEMDLASSVAFGVVSRDQSLQSLNTLLAQQQQFAPQGLASTQNIYNTLSKIAETAGFKSAAPFFTDPSSLPPAPPPPPPVDPNAGLIAVEQAKAQLRAQSDAAQREYDGWKARLEDDRERDRMAQEFELKRAEIAAKYQAQVDIARVQMEQAAQRNDTDFAIAAQKQVQDALAAQQAEAAQAQQMQAAQAEQAAQVQQAAMAQQQPMPMPPQGMPQ